MFVDLALWAAFVLKLILKCTGVHVVIVSTGLTSRRHMAAISTTC